MRIGPLVERLRSLFGRGVSPNECPKRTRQKDANLESLRAQLDQKDREIEKLLRERDRGETGSVEPKNVIWMFCTGRSGSTWLSEMMGDLPGHSVWKEPLVGELFGYMYYVRGSERHRKSKHFILGSHRQAWLKSVRSFVLDGAGARFPELAEGDYLVIKEPNGSIGAPLLVEALPESRVVFLVRDPRDTVASALDSRRKGGWASERRRKDQRGDALVTGEDADAFVKQRARVYLRDVGNSKEAYEIHQGPKTLVRYEDLRTDPLGEMRRLYAELGMGISEEEISRVVEEHAWERIPEEERGEGKFYRKAKPGGWREDLSAGQARAVERITAPLLREFYPE